MNNGLKTDASSRTACGSNSLWHSLCTQSGSTRSSAITQRPRDAKASNFIDTGRGNDNLDWSDLQVSFKSGASQKLVYVAK